MNKHKLSHDGTNPQCHLCGKTYMSRQNLDFHIRKAHDKQNEKQKSTKYKCDNIECDNISFSNKILFRKHQMTHMAYSKVR